jgi:vacuolar protein sorting-associated protein 35
MFFRDEAVKGRSQGELYDLVQHAGNIVPRLYLLCTGGRATGHVDGKQKPLF